jgi:CubicO group peptidase (beta-lactamase class C family)
MLSAALASAWTLSACAQTPDLLTSSTTSAYEAYLTQCHEAYVCNGTYLVARSGKVVFAGAVGDGGGADQAPLSVDSAFDIGSVSKQMTAAAVLMLAAEGRLSIDDRVAEHLPRFPYAEVTIAQLLSHTSGIPDVLGDYAEEGLSSEGGQSAVVDGADIVRFLAEKAPPTIAPPGSEYAYNNTGYMVLASLVESVSGRPFADFLQDTFFTPLGMANTRLRTPANDEAIADRVWGFRPRPAGRQAQDQIPRLYIRGAGGVYSTVEDLLLWQKALNQGLVRTDLWARATAPAVLTDGTTVPYGFGLSLKPDVDGRARISHGGHWRAFRSDLSYFPAEDLVVIQLTNNAEDDSVDENVSALRRIAEGGAPAPVVRRIEWDLFDRVETQDGEQVRAWFQSELNSAPRRFAFSETELNALGYSYLHSGQDQRAALVFELTTIAFPESANAWDSLADAHEALGDNGAALEAVKMAVQLEPSSATYADHLARLERAADVTEQ